MDDEERESVLLRSGAVLVLLSTLTYLVAWDEGSPIYAGDSLIPILCLWAVSVGVGLGLLVLGHRMLASGERRRGRPAEVVTWGWAVLLGTGGMVAAAVGLLVLAIASGGAG